MPTIFTVDRSIVKNMNPNLMSLDAYRCKLRNFFESASQKFRKSFFFSVYSISPTISMGE